MSRAAVSLLGLLLVVLAASQCALARGGPRCSADSWKACVGKKGHCPPCFQKPAAGDRTVERRIVEVYNQDVVVDRDYELARKFFHPDVVTEVPFIGVAIHGLDNNINYFNLGDPDVSDLYEVRSITPLDIVQQERYVPDPDRPHKKIKQNVVVAYLTQILYSLQLEVEFETQFNQWFYFDDVHRVTMVRIFQDTVKIRTFLPSPGDTNITRVCNNIQTFCTGPYQFYASQQACEAFMQTIPLTSPINLLGSGNTVACRAFHTRLAKTLPEVHCLHASPLDQGPLDTPCSFPNF